MCRELKRWRHPRQMLQELTAEEWDDWYCHYHLQPFGEHRADLRQEALIGTLAAPLMPDDYRLPTGLYPYEPEEEETAADVDYQATSTAVQAMRALLDAKSNGNTASHRREDACPHDGTADAAE